MLKFPPTACIALCLACCLLTGCASRAAVMQTGDQSVLGSVPEPAAGQDHYIAWIPAERATTPTVARTLMHIALGKARAHTSTELCAGGSLLSGEIISVLGPVPALRPQHADSDPAWYYRISQQPGLHGCDSQQQDTLYRSLQQNLPDWITLQAAFEADPRAPALLGSAR